MPGRYRQLRMRDPDVFLLLPATSLAHSHARILRTFPVDLFSFCFTYPDLHHGLLADGGPTGKWSEKITASNVLSHSSGLMNWRDDKDQELTPAFEPGTKFRYSGEGFYCLQRCVEHITGVGFEQWMQDRVIKPLGMKSSTYLWRADGDSRIVAGHRGDE